MLVLTRRTNESVLIGSEIKVTVVAVNGRSVRLGITAPKHIPIDRLEISEKRREERGGTDPKPSR